MSENWKLKRIKIRNRKTNNFNWSKWETEYIGSFQRLKKEIYQE
jgi:hypothetical protein